MRKYMSEVYRNPIPTVDAIIELPNEKVVLIERAREPFGWALPGGFVDEGERLEDACIREALEETCLEIKLVCLLGVYSDPKRDPRKHTVSTVYIATATQQPKAADDAASAQGVPIAELLDRTFAFDHAEIIKDYLHFKQSGKLPPPRPTNQEQQTDKK